MHIHNVTLGYDKKTILRDINITIEPGEFVFLIGSSGSGKTSFIKSLIGALRPKKGQIIDNQGEDIYKLGEKSLLRHRRNIGVIFQDFKLLPRKTVRENVAFAMEVCGYDEDTIHGRVPEILAQVGLIHKKETFIESLSGGEIQRTSIARALIHHPNIIIGDEPTGNLDRHNAEEVMHLLEELSKSGKTVIIATHDDRIVNEMKKRVIAFREGSIVSDTEHGNYCL